ncbi:hypothetical protein KDH_36310 [Dictyobacter sp. S3.2.2.5]|uniref:Uncharacterized protein n=1 Tax=Dictyobacter halimunensis TaxID=3026934 RepID=A0ABQ6FSQ4_9CHLR|nr:hypothetical protein KDH_36310 [Dictyobacter sp. S3.2.2.5]
MLDRLYSVRSRKKFLAADEIWCFPATNLYGDFEGTHIRDMCIYEYK